MKNLLGRVAGSPCARWMAVVTLLVAAVFATASCGTRAGAVATRVDKVKIGVLLPLSGDRPLDWERILDSSVEKVNAACAGSGFAVELVYKDTFGVDATDLARELLRDESIQVAIGPMTSREAMMVVPQFERAGRLLISPCATSDDLFRAFSGERCFVRTCQSDAAQARTILNALHSRGTRRFSLAYEDTVYGRTFFNWTGFLAREMGMELVSQTAFTPGQSDMDDVVARALEGGPETLLLAAFPEDTDRIARSIESASRKGVEIFTSDAAVQQTTIDLLGEAAEGFEGVTPAPDPSSSFESDYIEEYGRAPEAWAAETQDAIMLAASACARQRATGSSSPIYDSFLEVATSKPAGTDAMDAGAGAVKTILGGKLPQLYGATGRIVYDDRYGVDPLFTFYSRWVVRGGQYRMLDIVSSEQTVGIGLLEPGAPSASALPSQKHMNRVVTGGQAPQTPRQDLWAVIVAASAGIENYRHQADALGMYACLKANGVRDDRIILMLVDDVKDDAGNPDGKHVRDMYGGIDLRDGARIDYSGDQVTAENLEHVLLGDRTDGGLPVLGGGAGSNVLLYIAGNADEGRLLFDNSGPMTPARLGEVTGKLSKSGRYRQLLIMAQMSGAEDFCRQVRWPSVVCLCASAHAEAALPKYYHMDIGTWLSDQFTSAFIETVGRHKNLSVSEVYQQVYLKTSGSHVRLLNYEQFDILGTPISDFISD